MILQFCQPCAFDYCKYSSTGGQVSVIGEVVHNQISSHDPKAKGNREADLLPCADLESVYNEARVYCEIEVCKS